MGRKDADRDQPVKPAATPAKPAAKLAEGSRIGVEDTLAVASQVAIGDTMAAGPATQPTRVASSSVAGPGTQPAKPRGDEPVFAADATMAAGPATQPPKPRGDEPVFVADATIATPAPGSIRRVAPGGPASASTLAQSVANDATMAGGFTGTGSQGEASHRSALARGGLSRIRAGTDVGGLELPIVDDANYERLEEFARGGLGRIVRAKDRRTGRIVALKEMLGDADETAKRFAREARVTANLMHPAIVPVYELGRWPSGEPFFAMKLVAGRSLQQVTSELKTLEERLARLGVIVAVSDALAYAHEQRVIHRDLKPANVLVGEFGETVVIDWGLAKVVDESQRDPSVAREPTTRESSAVIEAGSIGEATMDGSVLGTPSYMSPEQALGNPADQRSDVYAIGAMLYQLITGVTPFSDKAPKNLGELLRMVENEPPTPVGELAPQTPADLVTIIAKAMARDRSERYPSARELADDLRRFTAGQLVRAHEYDRWTLIKRWLKKNRAAVTVAAALVLVLAVFAVFSVRSIIQERDSAEVEMNKAKTARDHADKKTQEAKDSLATALYQKGRTAEGQQRWADAAMYYAAARTHSDSDRARWSAGLAEARAIVPHTRHVGHTEPVTASAISRDGERVVTVDSAGGVRVWKRADGSLLAQRKLADSLWSVAYSPDGREIAVGGDSGIVRRMTPSLDPVSELKGHVKRVWSLAYSLDSRLIASGGEDTFARLWNLTAGGEPKKLPGHTQRVYSVSFSPDGRKLATGSDDRTLWIWDVEKGTGALRGAQQNGGIRAVEFTRAGDGVVAGGWDFDLKVWPTDGGQPASWNDRMSVHDLAVSPDGRVVISVGDTGELRFWEVSTHNLITVIDLPGGRTNTVTMSEDGRWLVTAGNDRVPVVWNIMALQRLVDAVGHRGGISQLSLTSDDTRVVTVADDSTVRVWNLADGREQLQIALPTEQGKRHYCSSPVLSKDGVIALGCDDKLIRRWDLTGRELSKIPTKVYVRIVSLSPDNKTIAAGHMKGIGGLYDIATGKVLQEKALHGHQIYGLAYAPTGHIATGSLDNTAKAWTSDLKLVREFRIDGEDGVLQARLSGDATVMVAGAQDGVLYAWEVSTGKRLGKVKTHVGPIWGLAFSNDNRVVYTAGEDGSAYAWDAMTWKQLGALDARESGGGPLAITADNKTAVTGYRNGAMVVWDLTTYKVRYRIGGNARDFGSCGNVAQQRWVDDAHQGIVKAACTEEPARYFDRIQRLTHRRIQNDVDVKPAWESASAP